MSRTASPSMWLPQPMAVAPALDPLAIPGPRRKRYALLINPFYRKDPHASFGKHVLTPTLALTSVAASTPADWQVRYWDENLLQGPPPSEPVGPPGAGGSEKSSTGAVSPESRVAAT